MMQWSGAAAGGRPQQIRAERTARAAVRNLAHINLSRVVDFGIVLKQNHSIGIRFEYDHRNCDDGIEKK